MVGAARTAANSTVVFLEALIFRHYFGPILAALVACQGHNTLTHAVRGSLEEAMKTVRRATSNNMRHATPAFFSLCQRSRAARPDRNKALHALHDAAEAAILTYDSEDFVDDTLKAAKAIEILGPETALAHIKTKNLNIREFVVDAYDAITALPIGPPATGEHLTSVNLEKDLKKYYLTLRATSDWKRGAFVFWRRHREKLPGLFHHFLKWWSVPITVCTNERGFSGLTALQREKDRNRSAIRVVCGRLIVWYNYRTMDAVIGKGASPDEREKFKKGLISMASF